MLADSELLKIYRDAATHARFNVTPERFIYLFRVAAQVNPAAPK